MWNPIAEEVYNSDIMELSFFLSSSFFNGIRMS